MSSKEKVQLTLNVLGGSYTLLCYPHERNLLIESAEYLNHLLFEQRQRDMNISHDRLIARVALMICFELFQERDTFSKEASMANEVIEKSSIILKQMLEEEKGLRA